MVGSVQSLMNMENQLYGSYGMSSYAPSMYNNYTGLTYNNASSVFSDNYFPYQYGSNYGNISFGQGTPSTYAQYSNNGSASTYFQGGLSGDDINNLADYYAKNNALEDGLKGAATGGISWMMFEHLQSVLHPLNAAKGVKATEEIFKNIPKEFYKENANLLQDAYIAAQQATRDTGSKWAISGWLRRPIGYHHPGDEKKIEEMVKNLGEAIKSKNVEEIAKYSAELQGARGFDGKLIPGKNRSVAERLADKYATPKNGGKPELVKARELLETTAQGKFGTLVKSTFKKDFMSFMLFEAVASLGKITTAFKKDTNSGVKQTGQSLGKAALGTAGWCVGRAAGTWLGAKAGAAIGTAICPGAGTLVGSLIGFTVGSIGMWLGHKVGNAVLGEDVADKIEAEKMAGTQEGQAQLLQFAAQKVQEGKADPRTQQIVYKALNAYA